MKDPKYRLFLYKNGPAEEGKKTPYFTMKLIDENSDDWKEVGVFWKAASGKGYSGFLAEGVELDTSNFVSYKQRMEQRDNAQRQYDDLD
jgi:hypothetical protein